MPLFLKAFSTDNFLSLKRDSVSAKQDLLELGIEPTRIEWVVPDYLAADPKQARMDQFRREIN
jgi:NADH dehydrogenase